MNKIFFTATLLASLFLGFVLSSCGDDYLASNTTTMRAFVMAVPDRYAGNLGNIPVQEYIYVEQNQSVKMYAGVILDNNQYFGDDIIPFYKSITWEIDGETFNLPYFRYTLKTTGHKYGSLTLVDYLDDTTHTKFEFFVNTPNKISIDFPFDGYNQVDPENSQTLPLKWTTSGIDEWETATCKVYFSTDWDKVWKSPIAEVDCFDDVAMSGRLVDPAIAIETSVTYYWGVKLEVSSNFQETNSDSTDIVAFSTKINSPLSKINLPYTFNNYRSKEYIYAEATLVAANGDTLEVDTLLGSSNNYIKRIAPQSNLKIILRSLNRKEYKADSVIFDVPENTALNLDRMIFNDITPPQAAPANERYNYGEGIGFYIYDDGSGMNANTITTVIDKDTIAYDNMTPGIFFHTSCKSECTLHIYGQDYAGNKLPNVDWKLTRENNYLFVTGPFKSEDN